MTATTEQLAILANPDAFTPAQVQAAELATIERTDNTARPEDGEQPDQPEGDA